jgi:hypothetical protein
MKNTHKSKKTQHAFNGLRGMGLALIALNLTHCTTLTEKLSHQTQTLTAALDTEREAQIRKDALALTFTQRAQAAIHQPQGSAEADRWLTLPENLLDTGKAATPQVTAQSAPALVKAAVKQEQVDQAKTNQAVQQLDQTVKIAAQHADQEQQNSAWFGLPGLFRYSIKVVSDLGLLLLSLILISALFYLGASFYPPLAPLLSLIDSTLISFLSKLVSFLVAAVIPSRPPSLPTSAHS